MRVRDIEASVLRDGTPRSAFTAHTDTRLGAPALMARICAIAAIVIVVVVVILAILLALDYRQLKVGGGRGDTDKASLLKNLTENTYVRLAPGVAGVGVVAIRDIPKGVNPFQTVGRVDRATIDLTKAEVDTLPQSVRKLVTDFVEPDERGLYTIPRHGMSTIDTSWYLNDSLTPNVALVDNPASNFVEFKTTRLVPAGTELMIRYADYGKL